MKAIITCIAILFLFKALGSQTIIFKINESIDFNEVLSVNAFGNKVSSYDALKIDLVNIEERIIVNVNFKKCRMDCDISSLLSPSFDSRNTINLEIVLLRKKVYGFKVQVSGETKVKMRAFHKKRKNCEEFQRFFGLSIKKN